MEAANLLVPITLFAFLPVVAVLYVWLGPRRAAITSLLGGWLLLPSFDGKIDVPFLTGKTLFVPVVVLAGALAFDTRTWLKFRPRWLDLPMALWCLEPFLTSTVNELGAYDGAHAVFQRVSVWGVPYLLGRVYMGQPGAVREFADAFVIAALAYVPLCLLEVRLSPTLHLWVYGFHPMDFLQAVRFGGYRPNVFLSHGLMLGMILATATLIAYWEWRTRARTHLLEVPFGWVVLVLGGTTLLTKATGSILLLALGIAVLEGTRRLRSPWPVLVLMLLPPAYSAARIGGWNGNDLVSLSRSWIDSERADSLKFRLDQENALIERAMERPGLGWGGWGRSRLFDEEGRDISVTDGMWIITLGVSGLVGLVALGLLLALPVLALLRRFPARYWGDPRIAAAVSMGVTLLLWATDNLLNAMTTPLAAAMAGALVTFSLVPHEARRRPAGAVEGSKPVSQPRRRQLPA
jgi:hypothetical protein